MNALEASPPTLKGAERHFASLLLGQLEFLIDSCEPLEVSPALREIAGSIELVKELRIPGVMEYRLFTPLEIYHLALVISPLCENGRKQEEIRLILKEALKSHHIPNDI